MTSPKHRDDELRRREQELQDRERALRLRELEAEIYAQPQPNEPPIARTTKHQEPKSSLQKRYKQALEVAKFIGIVVAVVFAIRIATWLATAVLIGGVAWVAYKLFLAGDRAKR